MRPESQKGVVNDPRIYDNGSVRRLKRGRK